MDELNEATDLSLGLKILRLIGLEQNAAPAEGRQLVEQTRREVDDAEVQQKFIELIETILVYKFSELSREEIIAMLRLDDLKQTRVYRDALEEGREEGREEGKLAAVPLLLRAGMTVEQIAEQLQVDLAAVRQVAAEDSGSGLGEGEVM